jgi:hypothetical protein
MKIGFDLDKIFINTPPFIPKSFIEKLYKKRDYGELVYRTPGAIEQIIRNISHLPILRPAMMDNLNLLKNSPRENNKFYLISSRFKFLEKRTQNLTQRYQLDKLFDKMFFNFANEQPHIFKNRIIKNLKLDYYIDDDLSLIKYVAKHNPKTKFFWLTQESKKIPLPKNIFIIQQLSDIFNIISKEAF